MRINTRKHDVESSNLASVGYSRKYGVLDVIFKSSGDTYRYFNVPRKIYDRLMRSTSKGVFYNTFIRGNVNYSPIKLDKSNLDTKALFKATNPTFIRNHRFLVINGETGVVERVSSSADWAIKDAETWANNNPGHTYYPTLILGEASIRGKAVFLPSDLKNRYKENV